MKELFQLDPVGIGSGCQWPERQFQPHCSLGGWRRHSELGSGHSWLFPQPQGGSVMEWGWQGDFGELSVLEVRTGLAPSQHY